MVTVKIGNATFSCETAQEAVEIARLMNQQAPTIRAENSFTNAEDYAELSKFIDIIKSLNSSSIRSEDLAKQMGMSLKGLGPRIGKISRQFETKYGTPFNRVVRREGYAGQPSIWKIDKRMIDALDLV